MENKEEEAIVRKWEEQERDRPVNSGRAPKKRKMKEIENVPAEVGRIVELEEDSDATGAQQLFERAARGTTGSRRLRNQPIR